MAWEKLQPNARDQAATLLGFASTDPAAQGKFGDSCNWADESAQKKKRQNDHWINVPRSFYDIQRGSCVLAETCLFSAIRHDSNVLAYSENQARRSSALKYLGHWIGDLHQPLHVSYEDDLGGNTIKYTKGACGERTLHQIWDSCIVEKRLPADDDKALDALIALAGAHPEWDDAGVVDWADESYRLAMSKGVGYCETKSAGGKRSCEPRAPVKIDNAYLAEHEAEVKERLAQAGVRLAAVLNRLLDPPDFE